MRKAHSHTITTSIMLGPASIQSQPVSTEKPAWAQLRTNASAAFFEHPSPKHTESLYVRAHGDTSRGPCAVPGSTSSVQQPSCLSTACFAC